MTSEAKWPFGRHDRDPEHSEQDRAVEREHKRLAAETFHRQHLRHDRFLVGGRAHARKRGLS